MPPLTDAMIINGAVLFATLEADLGPHRKIGLVRTTLMRVYRSPKTGKPVSAATWCDSQLESFNLL